MNLSGAHDNLDHIPCHNLDTVEADMIVVDLVVDHFRCGDSHHFSLDSECSRDLGSVEVEVHGIEDVEERREELHEDHVEHRRVVNNSLRGDEEDLLTDLGMVQTADERTFLVVAAEEHTGLPAVVNHKPSILFSRWH